MSAILAAPSFLIACQAGGDNGPGDPAPARGGGTPATGGAPIQPGGSGGSPPVTGTGGTPPVTGTGGTPGTGGSAPVDSLPAETSPPEVGGETPPPAVPSAVCPAGPFPMPQAGPAEGICPGFTVKYNWNEGPTWVAKEKAFFFSNFVQQAAGPGDMIKYDPATNKCEVYITGNGCNGLSVDRDGNLIAACHTPRAVLRYDLATKQSTVLVDKVDGRALDSPNDLVAHRNGTIYFTNPPYELGGRPQGYGNAVFRIDPAGMVHLIARGGANPIGLSPDGKRLYVMGAAWDVDDAGVPTRAGGFTLGGDGIAVDCAGNVYTNGGAIISPQNQRIGSFPGGTNMAFGGEDGKTLLVVSNRNMRVVKMNLPGLP